MAWYLLGPGTGKLCRIGFSEQTILKFPGSSDRPISGEAINNSVVDDKAIDAFLEHYDFVLKSAYVAAHLAEEASDILQNVFIDFIEKYSSFQIDENDVDAVKKILSGMVRIAAYRARSKWLKHQPSGMRKIFDRFEQEMKQSDEWEEMLFSDDVYRSLEKCLDSLPPRSRELLERHYMNGERLADIAHEIGVNDFSLRQRLRRIREKLKQCIDKNV